MQCPYCNQTTSVTNSRKSNGRVWRRRKCSECGKIFTTYETMDLQPLLQVTNQIGDKSAYSQSKLLLSIIKACDHLIEAPNKSTQITYLCAIIEGKLRQNYIKKSPITSAEIATAVSVVLKNFDNLAYIKYCASHGITPDGIKP